MKRLFFTLILFLITAAAVDAQSFHYAAESEMAHHQEKSSLKYAIERLDQALLDKDTLKLIGLLHDQLEMIHSNGMVETKTDLLENLGKKFLQYQEITWESKETEFAQVEGERAMVERVINVKGVLRAKDFTVRLNTQEEWSKESGEWQLIKRVSKKRD